MLLLLLFWFIFAVLGMSLFGGNPWFSPDNNLAFTWRKNFNSFFDAMCTVRCCCLWAFNRQPVGCGSAASSGSHALLTHDPGFI